MKNEITMKTHLNIYLALLLVFLEPGQAFSQQLSILHPPLAIMKITSPFGPRVHPVTHKTGFHNGVDLAARASPVFSILAGTVLRAGAHPNLGNFITVSCSGMEVTYGHLSRILVKPREALNAGHCIGVSGKTGRVTGEHLHLSIKCQGRYLCPIAFMDRLTSLAGE